MYNTHRGMVPAPNSRLTELLDQLRQEFESQSRSTGEFEHQCMSLPMRYLTVILRYSSGLVRLGAPNVQPLRSNSCQLSFDDCRAMGCNIR
jgi:hypothetical protein